MPVVRSMMNVKHEAARFKPKPYIIDVGGVSVFQYPDLRVDFANNLINLGAAAVSFTSS
jgi:hypothetical protein